MIYGSPPLSKHTWNLVAQGRVLKNGNAGNVFVTSDTMIRLLRNEHQFRSVLIEGKSQRRRLNVFARNKG